MDYSGSGAERGRGGTGMGDAGFSGGAAPAGNVGGGGADAAGVASLLSQADFNALNNITITNPYGASFLGFKPENVDYSNLLSEYERERLMNLAYDRYKNPYATKNVLGGETMSNPEIGKVRYGLSPGDETQYGVVTSVPAPKSQERLMMESMPSIIGLLSTLAPDPKMSMIEGAGKEGVPTAAEGYKTYEQSKMLETPNFLDYILGGFTK